MGFCGSDQEKVKKNAGGGGGGGGGVFLCGWLGGGRGPIYLD